ncbi:Na/Pi cotransporter family protein [Paracoccus sp. CPCC 101403]|uniref:Na/Pi cotransporter family protein n=1 Tax=Paracoccus broussonetiae TaxID=3075834 RepID=A0ABU3EHT1_9RHOB|nr:Na/Pi cotransporter family protein [Paracoccus sp. CPCC 101403]MDT1063789.1 Na/Pi cotransporter family protein [Paracoccus sp. CPCC 101403]
MNSTIQLIDLLGAAALLLWGLRMIKTGVLRAYGAVLRQWLARGAGNRVAAAFWGFVATLGLQSSTATAVIIGSFAGRGIVQPRMGQAMMLGANLGTAIVTLVLSADVHWIGSAAIFLGVLTHNLSRGNRSRNLGRAVLGLGFMLLALQLLGHVTEPLRDSPTVAAILSGLGDAPVFALLLAAGLAILGSSSLAVVVLVMLLAGAGVVGPELALWLVAGANLGGAVPPWLAVRAEGAAAERLTLANLMVRAFGALLVLILAGPISDGLGQLLPAPASFVVGAHVAFNLALLLLFLPCLSPVAHLAAQLVPDPVDSPEAKTHLDDALLPMPEMALAVAARETLRLGDLVDEMLGRTVASLRDADEAPIAEVSRLEEQVDRLTESVKLYVARLSRGELDEAEARRATEIVSYAINLEHVGDIVEGGIAEIATKKLRKKLTFSAEGQAEISAFFLHTQENLRMAQAIFLSRDAALARRLVARKVESRRIEAQSADCHMARMRIGRAETLETSTIHLDILRDLKRVNAHIASVAYPILEELGMLEESRLKGDLVAAR